MDGGMAPLIGKWLLASEYMDAQREQRWVLCEFFYTLFLLDSLNGVGRGETAA